MPRLLIIISALLSACGGSAQRATTTPGQDSADEETAVGYSAEDLVSRAVVVRADLTTAVDAKRYRATAPPKTEFSVTDPIIYMVGRLKRVPTDSTIEVHWFLDESPRPLLVSDIQGSDKYQFVASFKPTERKFIRGSYTARILIDGEEIGARSFVVRDEVIEARGSRISGVKFSTKVNRKMKAVRPATRFKTGARKIWISFKTSGFDHGVVAEVEWLRGEQTFHTEDVTLDGDRRYAAHLESMEGLPSGDYAIKIRVVGDLFASNSFRIGKETNGPAVDAIALGLELRANNMPVKQMTAFSRDTRVIQCGLRFLDLPRDAVIELQWTQVSEEGDFIIYTNRSVLPAGGSGTMGAAWEPTRVLEPGDYKVVVVINGEALGEEIFAIE